MINEFLESPDTAEQIARLAITLLVLSAGAALLFHFAWKRHPRHRSAGIALSLALFTLLPILALSSSLTGIGWHRPTDAANNPLQGTVLVEAAAPAIPEPVEPSTDVPATINTAGSGSWWQSLELSIPSRQPTAIWTLNMFGLIWTAGMIVGALRLLRGLIWVSRLIRNTRPITQEESEKLGPLGNSEMDAPVRIRITQAPIVPFLTGIRGGTVVLPESFLNDLPDHELQMILRHEFSHYTQRDHWLALLQNATVTLNWWNPFVRRLSDSLTQLREEISDHEVVRHQPAPLRQSYSELLVRIAEECQRPPRHACALAATSTFRSLQARLLRLRSSDASSYRPPSRILVMSGCVVATFFTVVGGILTSAPAQDPAAELEGNAKDSPALSGPLWEEERKAYRDLMERTWAALELLADADATISEKQEMVKMIREPEEWPYTPGGLSFGAMGIRTDLTHQASLSAEKEHPLDEAWVEKMDIVLRASDYLATEADGPYSDGAHTWLAMLWGVAYPVDGHMPLSISTSSWRKMIEQYPMVIAYRRHSDETPPVTDSGEQASGRTRAWDAMTTFTDSNTSIAAKQEVLKLIRSPGELPTADNPLGGELRRSVMSIGTDLKGIAEKRNEGQPFDDKTRDLALRASEFLKSEVEGPYSDEANEWLALLWGLALPMHGAKPPHLTADQWSSIIETHPVAQEKKPRSTNSRPKSYEELFMGLKKPFGDSEAAPVPGKTPEETAQALYDNSVFFGLRNSFPDPVLKYLCSCFTSELREHFKSSNEEIEEWLANVKDVNLKLNLSEGPIFISNYEGADGFRVGDARIEDTRAEVPVSFWYQEKGKTYRWENVAILRFNNGVWLLDDIHFNPKSRDKWTLRKRISIREN